MTTDSSMWTPLQQGRVPDLIADRILALISSEKLHPGSKLPPERELATLLGTSRPSLREALRALQVKGHVEIRHGAGVFVADPATTRSLREAVFAEEMSLAELFDMREVLELPAVSWAAANQDREKLAAVRKAFEALDEASARDKMDWARLQQLDAAFHLSIVRAAGNRFLSQTLTVLQDILARGMETTLRVPGRLERSRVDHRKILEAVLDGQPSIARRAAAVHIRGARKAAFARLHDENASV
ncbi:FadR/GntR family transcriptional regulator [Amycolatopsis alkalitolerans]|nr:FadR/GntR family transcriptional regulator [Amycolatopsis alkalitolerans]